MSGGLYHVGRAVDEEGKNYKPKLVNETKELVVNEIKRNERMFNGEIMVEMNSLTGG